MSFLGADPKLIGAKKINDGDSGIRQTVMDMRKQMNLAKHDLKISKLVRRLVEGLSSDTEKSQAMTDWFHQNIQYVNDDDMSWTEQGAQFINILDCPSRFNQCEPMEILNQPERLLFFSGKGDCDDFVMALGVMHELAGIPIRIVTIAADASVPREFTHVYFQAQLDGSWVPIDPVNRANPWGWEYEKPFRREVMV